MENTQDDKKKALEQQLAEGVNLWRRIGAESISGVHTEENEDGTVTNTVRVNFGHSLLQTLWFYVGQMLTSGRLSEEKKQELEANAKVLERLLSDIKVKPGRKKKNGKTEVQLVLTPKDEGANEGEGAEQWLKEVTEALYSPTIKTILSYLLSKFNEGGGGGGGGNTAPEQLTDGEADEILYSDAALQQNFDITSGQQLRLLPMETAEGWAKEGGVSIERQIDSYGIDLNEGQQSVLKAILRAFTATDYKGNTGRLPLEESGRIPKYKEDPDSIKSAFRVLQNGKIKTLPQIQITQAELFRLCGIKNEDRSLRQRALEDLAFLGREQFVFWWQRFVKKEVKLDVKRGKGQHVKLDVVRDKETGEAEKEDVYEVGTLLRVKEVRDEKTLELKYYEIAPSLVMLEHFTSGHFVYYPYRLEREVQQKTGKRLKKYEAQLLLWLAFMFEKERRHRIALKRHGNLVALAKAGGEIPKETAIDWQELARQLKMPETLRIKNKKKGRGMIERACSIAAKAGFLTGYEIDGTGTIKLVFNPLEYKLPDAQKKLLEGEGGNA